MKLTIFRKLSTMAVSMMIIAAFAVGCSKGDSAEYASSVAESKMSIAAHDGVAAQLASPSTGAVTLAPTAYNGPPRGEVTDGSARNASLSMPPTPIPTVRQVIRKADLDVRVENVEKAEKAVGSIIQSEGGYTESASSTDLASTHPVLNLSLRVPVGSFDSSIARFEALGIRLSKKISSDDVTGQLVDLDARLKTLRAQEEVYRGMLKNRTQLDDVFNIQNQLRDVRTNIETISGQRKSQSELAALSTITLTLEQNAVANQAPSDPNWLSQTWGEASSGASASLRIFTVALVWLVAFSPFWIPLLLIARKALKSRPSMRREL